LTRALEQTTAGDQDDIYQLLAAWNTSLEAAMETGVGRTESVMKQYFEEVLSLIDAAAMGEEIDWEFLAECCDAYPTGVGDHACSSLLVNIVGRCVIRARLDDGVEAIPPWALDYLAAVTDDSDGIGNRFEATTFGWGIGHPESAVADRTVERAANGKQEWAASVLDHALVAETDAGIDLFEQLVHSSSVNAPLLFLTSLEESHERSVPLLPDWWNPPDGYDLEVELSEAQRQRILDILSDAVPADTLWRADTEFRFDLEHAADQALAELLPESVPSSMLHLGKHRGGKWHLLGEAGCPDGDVDRVETREPFFEFQHTTIDPIYREQRSLNTHSKTGLDICKRCASTVSQWGSRRYDYTVTRDERFEGGELAMWTPLGEDKWIHDCDICQKPAGATHTESTFDQVACPSCLRELTKPNDLLGFAESVEREELLSIDEILSGAVKTRILPPRNQLEERAREQRREHNRQREQLPLTHAGLTAKTLEILADHGYETVGDICDADPEGLAEISGLGREWRPERLPHEYTLSLSAFAGIGSTLATRLKEHGYATVPDLENASTEELAQIRGISESKATHILETVDSW
jgi:hypothetical protein